jgi:hypothetical protein
MEINMCGQKMEYSISGHAIQRVGMRTFLDSDDMFFSLALLLEREEVADYLLNEVKVGDDAVIIDEDSGVTSVVAMGLNHVAVKTVVCKEKTTFWTAMDQFTILIKNAKVVAASLFQELQPTLALY